MGGEARKQLPPGFHFFPTDEELVLHFLRPKATLSSSHHPDIIPILDLSLQHPWELTGKALAGGDGWYFFSKKQDRPASAIGYWTAVGDDETVMSGNETIGVKKLLAFCDGEGATTNIWMMHEYHYLSDQGCSSATTTTSSSSSRRRRSSKKGTTQESGLWVLCRLFERICHHHDDDGSAELSSLDEVFLSLDDDVDDICLPKD